MADMNAMKSKRGRRALHAAILAAVLTGSALAGGAAGAEGAKGAEGGSAPAGPAVYSVAMPEEVDANGAAANAAAADVEEAPMPYPAERESGLAAPALLSAAAAPSKLHMEPGVNAIVPIAMFHANRIVTPFRHPQVISSTLTAPKKPGEPGEVSVRGSAVYITTDKNYPVSAFITEKGDDAVALSLTLIPKRIPPREVSLLVSEAVRSRIEERAEARAAEVARTQAAEAYESFDSADAPRAMHAERAAAAPEDVLRGQFRALALGKVPAGFAMRAVKAGDKTPVCRQSGLQFQFERGQRLTGSRMNIYVGTVRNTSGATLAVRESSCAEPRVAGAALWPESVLRPGEASEVYVAVREPLARPESGERRALLSAASRR